MKTKLLALIMVLFLLPVASVAAPPEALLAKIIEIADPDQVEAYTKLNLSAQQEAQLRQLAEGYAPQLQQAKGQPAKMMGILSGALAEADKFLTPAQRPLVRILIPRPHQWERLRRLRASYE